MESTEEIIRFIFNLCRPDFNNTNIYEHITAKINICDSSAEQNSAIIRFRGKLKSIVSREN